MKYILISLLFLCSCASTKASLFNGSASTSLGLDINKNIVISSGANVNSNISALQVIIGTMTITTEIKPKMTIPINIPIKTYIDVSSSAVNIKIDSVIKMSPLTIIISILILCGFLALIIYIIKKI